MKDNRTTADIAKVSFGRKPEIDILKAFGILMMLCGHIGIPRNLDHYFHAFHMPLFFIVSGYLFKAEKSPGMFWSNIGKKLVAPYLCCLFFEQMYCSVFQGGIAFPIVKIIKHTWPICGACWFIAALILIQAVAYYCLHYGSFHLFAVFVLFAVLFAVNLKNLSGYPVAGFLYRHARYFAFQPALTASGFFFAGCLLKRLSQKYRFLLDWPAWVSIIVLLLSLFTVYQNDYVNLRTGQYGNPILFFVNGIFVTLGYWNLFHRLYLWTKSRKIYFCLNYISVNSLCFLISNQFFVKFLLPPLFGTEKNYLLIFPKLMTLLFAIFCLNSIAQRIGLGWVFGRQDKKKEGG